MAKRQRILKEEKERDIVHAVGALTVVVRKNEETEESKVDGKPFACIWSTSANHLDRPDLGPSAKLIKC